MVSAVTKRKRRERENRVAAAIEEARSQASAEQKALGTTVTKDASNTSLFVEDRRAISKDKIRDKFRLESAAQRRASKRARRAAPTQRRSEAASTLASTGAVTSAAPPPPRKNKARIPSTDAQILARRTFDKPEGHVGNKSVARREAKRYGNGRENVWESETAAAVKMEITDDRRHMVQKMNGRLRRAPAILMPDSGMSVNPTYEQHQNKLGEALAKVVAEEDEERYIDKKLSFDPALLQESRDGEVGDTGMKVDSEHPSDDEDDGDKDDMNAASCVVPERKTRAQRNKEARKREMAVNITRKRAEEKRQNELQNLKEVTKAAEKEADKLNGTTKLRRRAERVPIPLPVGRPVMKRVAGMRVRKETAAERIMLSNDLSKSMRTVKMAPANPILRDRFLSFERRGMIEPPTVIPKEVWRMQKEKRQEELKDPRKRKGRGANSDLSFWKNGKKSIR